MRSRRFWHSCDPSFGPAFEYAGPAGRHWERAARRHERGLERALRFESRRHEGDDFFGAGLGVRRPLRFLAWKLDLDDEQTAALARILEQLKLERAQAALDLRRAAASLADAFAGEFARAQAESAAEQRAAAARRVQDAMAKALEALHALLEPEQRRALAELIRTGRSGSSGSRGAPGRDIRARRPSLGHGYQTETVPGARRFRRRSETLGR